MNQYFYTKKKCYIPRFANRTKRAGDEIYGQSTVVADHSCRGNDSITRLFFLALHSLSCVSIILQIYIIPRTVQLRPGNKSAENETCQ